MAKGQLHSTGTVCKAELKCPLEGDGESHFDTVDQLIDHTASTTGADVKEIRDIIGSGVKLGEAVSMARDGLLGGSVPSSESATPKVPATIEIDLSSATSEELSKKFLENLREMYPVSSVKDDGTGRLDAESDPDDYSVLMAADTAARNAATEMGYDDDEMEDFEESFTVNAELNGEAPNQSVSWSYEGNEFTSSGLTEDQARARQQELKAEGIGSTIV